MFGAAGMQLLGGALSDRRASGGFGGKRGGFLGGTGFNPDVLRAGHRADNRYFKQRMLWQTPYEDRFHWSKARKRGLTPQEYYGSPVPGMSTPSGPSGGAAVLGNMVSSANQSSKALISDAISGAAERDTALKQTKMQTDAQIKTAEISAGAQNYATDVNKIIQDNNWKLENRKLEETMLPMVAAGLKKTEQETRKLINEVATSTPKWVRSQKLLEMGIDNTIQTAILQRFGVDITSKDDMARLTTEQFNNLISVLFAAASSTVKEGQGLMGMITGLLGDDNYDIEPLGNNKKEKRGRSERIKQRYYAPEPYPRQDAGAMFR